MTTHIRVCVCVCSVHILVWLFRSLTVLPATIFITVPAPSTEVKFQTKPLKYQKRGYFPDLNIAVNRVSDNVFTGKTSPG